MIVTTTKEIYLRNFDAWRGGLDTLNTLSADDCEQLDSMLQDIYPDGVDETELNDFLWFERDTIAEWLGYRDWEHLERVYDGLDDEDIEGCGLVSALIPKYDSRASFYGKAQIDDHDDHISLYSYDTEVARYDKASGNLHVYGWYSATTARHIREFAYQLGITLPSGKDIEGVYHY